MQLRARRVDGKAGTGSIQWRQEGQEDFPENGQSFPYELPAGKEWQGISIQVPVQGMTSLLRIHLAGAEAMEFQSIRWSAGGKIVKEWDFSNTRP